jgi:hypothetical protein
VSEPRGAEVERLEAILVDLELSPVELRRDPSGDSWLPVEARALVAGSSACREALDDFVSGELDLWRARPEPVTLPAVDPFFTARVVEALPAPRSGTGLSPRRRALLLGLFHVIAGLLAYVVLTMVPESTARWAEQAHRMLTWGSESGGLWLAATAVASAMVLAFVVGRTHTPAA